MINLALKEYPTLATTMENLKIVSKSN